MVILVKYPSHCKYFSELWVFYEIDCDCRVIKDIIPVMKVKYLFYATGKGSTRVTGSRGDIFVQCRCIRSRQCHHLDTSPTFDASTLDENITGFALDKAEVMEEQNTIKLLPNSSDSDIVSFAVGSGNHGMPPALPCCESFPHKCSRTLDLSMSSPRVRFPASLSKAILIDGLDFFFRSSSSLASALGYIRLHPPPNYHGMRAEAWP